MSGGASLLSCECTTGLRPVEHVLLQPKAARNAHREVPQNDVVHVADDQLEGPGSINDVSILHCLHQRQVSLALPRCLFKGDLLFARLEYPGRGIKKDDQIRLRNEAPYQTE